MNYEALGRYTEAKEQLALLTDDIAKRALDLSYETIKAAQALLGLD